MFVPEVPLKHLFLITALPIVAACATPQQACERAALEDLRIVDRLIAETEANIDRGYGIEITTIERPTFRYCFGKSAGSDTKVGLVLCNSTELRTVEKPVALDLEAEEAKLRSLRAKRPSIAKEAARAYATCQERFPDG